MLLISILVVPLLGVLSLLSIKEGEKSLMRSIALITSLINLFLSLIIWYQFDGSSLSEITLSNFYGNNISDSWLLSINSVGVLGLDGISLFFVLLTTFITPICILSNWEDVSNNNFKYYLISFLILETLQIAAFAVTDLLLFYVFFESVLIPLFLIVGKWGSGVERIRAAFLLFIYTLFGSLWMLLAILTLIAHYGTSNFEYMTWSVLSNTNLSLGEIGGIEFNTQKWIWLAFFVSFAFKTPLFPVHSWLLWAHASAPLGGSIILAAVVLKLATYGYLRILLPILPEATAYFSPLVQTIAIVTLIIASLGTIKQHDTKALVAYSSIAHMAVVVLGIFSNTLQGIQGAILLSIAHGFVSPALFICVGGILYHRYHTRVISYFRGFATTMPVFTIIFFIFTISNMAVPLSANFVGEFLSLAGIFQQNPAFGILGATGIFFSACYSIFLFNRIAYGKQSKHFAVTKDINRREFMLLLPLFIATVALGVLPNTVLNVVRNFSIFFNLLFLILNNNNNNNY